ncbi:hypothetical protein [Alicyclobacillus sp. SO9]|uniref:hypothetical protein n=1 Tax=Alicyclobacillus sp. SO9 TaxID=2665646 RepID=UPI0018E8A0BE|nr:hypothetical protein [Alicyclobacillus sp. SO9]
MMMERKHQRVSTQYILFSSLFLLVLVGVIVHSYTALIILAIVGIVLAVVGDRGENSPSEPYKEYNKYHHV